MDYTERGTIEKAIDELTRDEAANAGFMNQTDLEQLVGENDELTSEGRLYFAGFVAGMLMTIRTFRDGAEIELSAEDATEIRDIINRREREFVEHWNGQRPD